MKPFLKLLVGLVAIALIGVFSIQRSALPGSGAAVETRLKARADAALKAAGAEWAEVEIDGQKAVLYGEAPSEEALKRATAALTGAPWNTPPLIGGVTAVDTSFATVDTGTPLIEPFVWLAERQDDELILSGYVPSEASRDAIAQLAAMRFSGVSILDQTEIARGAPPEDPWLTAASVSLQALARLQSGGVEASGARFTVTGIAANEEDGDAVRMLMDAAPMGIEGHATVSLSDRQAPVPALIASDETATPESVNEMELPVEASIEEEPAASDAATADAAPVEPAQTDIETPLDTLAGPPTPGLAPRPQSTDRVAANDAPAPRPADPVAAEEATAEVEAPTDAPSEVEAPVNQTLAQTTPPAPAIDPQQLADCTERLANATDGFRLSFASYGVELTAASDDRLRQIATLLLVCPTFNLEIIGHTDASGGEARNRQLSRARASSAAATLAGYGVSRDRVIIRGAGSREPIADNDTQDGRAQNRRIEFRPAPPVQD